MPRTRAIPHDAPHDASGDAPSYAPLDGELLPLAQSVGLLGAATPKDAHLERVRLLSDYARGRERLPAWTYEPDQTALARKLHHVASLEPLVRALGGLPLAALYQRRLDELHLELSAAAVVGTPGLAKEAALRFSRGTERVRADVLATAWLDQPDTPLDAATPRIGSDDRDARSLVSRLRAEVARRNLPFSVRTSPAMSALAAISGDTLWVAEGRPLAMADVERTVVHEIEAHAMPRARARHLAPGIFAIGTRGGSDDQEGYALWLEESRGVSSPGRRRELALRHRAVSLMRDGADFVAVVRAVRALGSPLEAALRVAERAFRGSQGVTPGLGREHVYLEAFVRVQDHLTKHPEDERVLALGQVALDAVPLLRAWVT